MRFGKRLRRTLLSLIRLIYGNECYSNARKIASEANNSHINSREQMTINTRNEEST